MEILYEDNHVIVVHKKAGMPMEPGKPGEPNLLDEVKQYLKKKYKKPGKVFLGIVQRLVQPVEGVVLLAKTSKGAARLSAQVRERKIRKTYLAIVEGKVSPLQGELRHFLLKDEEKKKAYISKEGDEAVLRYKVLASNDIYTKIEIELVTGRFHQIRAQMAAIGHPIAGDGKYGAKASFKDGIMLCAIDLVFQTATTGETIHCQIEEPERFKTLIS